MTKYDIITVGGGLGGAALAKAMTEHGAHVLVLERERRFKDRVRGEGMHAWGVPEARALGIYDLLRETCGLEVRWWDTYLEATLIDHRDFLTTTPHHSPLFGFYHPEMQEVLLAAAANAGAEVRRGAYVRDVQPERCRRSFMSWMGGPKKCKRGLSWVPTEGPHRCVNGPASQSGTIRRDGFLPGYCWKMCQRARIHGIW